MAKISPKAGVPMTPFMLDEGVEVDICPVTKGIWLDLGELRVITRLSADLPYFAQAMATSRETPTRLTTETSTTTTPGGSTRISSKSTSSYAGSESLSLTATGTTGGRRVFQGQPRGTRLLDADRP